MFENPRRGRSQIVFRTDIFLKIVVGCPRYFFSLGLARIVFQLDVVTDSQFNLFFGWFKTMTKVRPSARALLGESPEKASNRLCSFRLLVQQNQGRIQDFFRRGCTRLLLYFNTNKPHSFCRIPVVLENRRSSQGGGGVRTPCTLLLDPPLRTWYFYWLWLASPFWM